MQESLKEIFKIWSEFNDIHKILVPNLKRQKESFQSKIPKISDANFPEFIILNANYPKFIE